jgi:hypothetical protein
MAFWLAFSRLLAILAVVSLVGGASAAPAAAGPKASGLVVTVADDMSCCDQPPGCGDMKACPFAVLCVAKCPQGGPEAAAVMVRVAHVVEHVPYATQLGDGLPAPPPDHPPKA